MTYNISMKARQLRSILLIFWLILAGLIVWLKVLPLGKATYHLVYPRSINISGGKGFIGSFTPADRVMIQPDKMAKIIGDPVYFSVFTPRTFSEVKLTITYKNNLSSSTPVVAAGVLVDNILWRYKLAPLENKIIDEQFKDWYVLRENKALLLQKNKKYNSVTQFLEDLKNNPERICLNTQVQECLALYNADSLKAYLPVVALPKNIPSFKVIDIPLQGAHQFYFIAAKDQELKFDFDFADLNLNKQADPIEISIYQADTKIYSTVVADNFGQESSGQVRNFYVPLSYPSNSESLALYKLEIKSGDDIVIKKIRQAPSALSIIGHLHPVTVASLPLNFWTDSTFISLNTNNPASRQNFSFGDKNFLLPEPYTPYEFKNESIGVKKISLNHDDVILSTDGLFSFSPEDFFNPQFKELDRHYVLKSDLEYVLADYERPNTGNDALTVASVILNTKEAYREKGKYSFMISVPGLSLLNQGNLEIKEIKVEFSGRNLWEKLSEKIKSYVN